jgi:hypothetical protein
VQDLAPRAASEHDVIDLSHLREAAQRNHSIISLCKESEFGGPLLFNRVSAPFLLSSICLAGSSRLLRLDLTRFCVGTGAVVCWL